MTTSTRSGGRRRSNSSAAGVPDLVRPRYLHIPEGYDPNRTLGPEVAAVSTLAGFPPDPEQQLLLDLAFALDKSGRSLAFEVVVVAPRQNLKTGFFKQYALGQLFVRDEALVIWSAHEFDTSQEALNDLEALIDGSDTLRKRVKLTERGNIASRGAVPEIRLLKRPGLSYEPRLKFKTRTAGGGRGLSGRKVILDEGFALQPAQVGALEPVMLAQPDPQLCIGSSACRPESVVLWDAVQRGRSGNEPRMVYAEWCAPEPDEVCDSGDLCDHARTTPGCGCDKPELLTSVHSAITRGRIKIDTIVNLRRSMPAEEYAREVMGWHDEPLGAGQQFPKALWPHLVDDQSARPTGPALAVEVTLDRSASVLASAGRLDDARCHGDVLEYKPGTKWVVPTLVERADEVVPCVTVIDPSGPAGAFVPELLELGFSTDPKEADPGRLLYLVTGREYAQACGALVDDVKNDRFRHRNRPELNLAVEGVVAKKRADAYVWSRVDSTIDISPLVAVTLARHGYAVHGVWGYDVMESIW